jgi:hypothetical protein
MRADKLIDDQVAELIQLHPFAGKLGADRAPNAR